MKNTPVTPASPISDGPFDYFFKFWLILTLLPAFTTGTVAAIEVTLTPNSTSSVTTTPVSLHIRGLAPGGSVIIERFVDADDDGIADEAPIERFTVTDGQVTSIAGVRNTNMPGDEDFTANGRISTHLTPAVGDELGRLAGTQIVRVSSPTGDFTTTTLSLTITQPAHAQSISGTVTDGSTPVPYARVILLDANSDGELLLGVLADADGHFVVTAPAGSYSVIALRIGYVSNFGTAPVVVLGDGETPTQNLEVTAATTTISGTVADADTGAGLGGMQLIVESERGMIVVLSTNADGTYIIPVTEDVWDLWVSDFSTNHLGYLNIDEDNIMADTTSGPAAGVDIALPMVTALIYGTVTGSGANPLGGIEIWTEDDSNTYYSENTTDVSGHYVLGVTTGSWKVDVNREDLPGYVTLGNRSVTITGGQAIQIDFSPLPVTAHFQGTVTHNGSPAEGIRVAGNRQSDGGLYVETTTDSDGNFNLGVVGGTWRIYMQNDNGSPQDLVYEELNDQIITDDQTIDGLALQVRTSTAKISGYVKNAANQPIDANVYAFATIDGVNYNSNMQTGGEGHYSIPVINGDWHVGVWTEAYTRPFSVFTPISGADVTRNFTLSKAPIINFHPQDLSIDANQLVTFWMSAVSNGAMTYQWQVSTDDGASWINLTNNATYCTVTSSQLTVTATPDLNNYQYRCAVSNSFESVASNPATLRFVGVSPSESWRQRYFGNPANTGDGADTATPDRDGIPNILKYGLVIIPGSSGVSALPSARTHTYAEGRRLMLVLLRDEARNDITLQVQGADKPTGPWTPLATSTNGAPFTGAGFVRESNLDDGIKIVEVRDTVNMEATPRRFMRVIAYR